MQWHYALGIPNRSLEFHFPIYQAILVVDPASLFFPFRTSRLLAQPTPRLLAPPRKVFLRRKRRGRAGCGKRTHQNQVARKFPERVMDALSYSEKYANRRALGISNGYFFAPIAYSLGARAPLVAWQWKGERKFRSVLKRLPPELGLYTASGSVRLLCSFTRFATRSLQEASLGSRLLPSLFRPFPVRSKDRTHFRASVEPAAFSFPSTQSFLLSSGL